MPTLIFKSIRRVLGLVQLVALWFGPQAMASDDVIKMEPFNVTAYSGKIPLIDGFTGRDYEGSNPVALKFAQTSNQLLIGYHKKLVLDEIKHLQTRIKLGKDFEEEMNRLSASFGFGPFALDQAAWLQKERAIITRLIREPFFKIKALVAWDLDRLNKIAPHRPESKHATDLRYDPGAGRWERRMTDRWDVIFSSHEKKLGRSFATEKLQGLNLDTNRGFHFIEKGLPGRVPATAFQEVKLTYPFFFSETPTGVTELRYLQETFTANLTYIYDPFSWVARRDTRFRGGFSQECLEHVQAQRILVSDRDWFDAVLARFFSDIVTIKLEGADEIYALHMLKKRLGESPRALGLGLDLLNWNKGEKREAIDQLEAEARINPTNPSGFRFLLIDAYQRAGEPLVEKIRGRLLAQKSSREKINGRALLTESIAEILEIRFEAFAQRAKIDQEAQLARHALTRALAPSRIDSVSGRK